MDFGEPPERRMLREAVADVARSYGHAYYTERARRGEKATELWGDLARAGFVGACVPEAYGGGGAGIGELAAICEELAAAGCPLLLLVVSSAICAPLIARFGDEAQRSRWLPGMAAGEYKMAFAITEPDAGSNTHKLSAAATRSGAGYRLRGTKYYTSCADEADAVLVVARTERGLSLFIVDTAAPGLRMSPIPVEMVAPEKQFTLFFDDVELPADRLLGTEGEGLRQVFHGLNPERVTSAAISVGIARYALAKAASYARSRTVWDVPVGAHQGLAHPLAAAAVSAELAALMIQKAAWLYDTGQDAGSAANMAKYAAADAALACLDQAIQVHGGNGLSSEYGLADLWGIARLMRTAPVSREMILNYVAQHDLGLPRSY